MVIEVIVLEDSICIGRYYDNFSDLLNQLNIEDTKENRETKIVKGSFEIINKDIFDSINHIGAVITEVYQDELPPWFNINDVLERAEDAFKKWYKEHVLIDQEIDELQPGFYYLKNCRVECLSGNVEIEECINCQIDIMLGKSSIEWCRDTQIGEMFDEASVHDGSRNTVIKYAYENAHIEDEEIKLQYDYRNKEES